LNGKREGIKVIKVIQLAKMVKLF